MQLKFKAAKLIEAVDFISTVEPRALTAQQNSGAYLFNCKTVEGKPYCYVYSRSENQVARAGFDLDEMEGEGQFTLPHKHVAMIKKVPDDDIVLESTSENKTDGEAFVVTVRSSSGTKYDHTTVDPRLIAPCDKEFSTAKEASKEAATAAGKSVDGVAYPVGVLREALGFARPFLPPPDKKDNVPEHFNTIQIFDQSNTEWAKGDGTLFCSDASRAFYFESEDFKDKGFTIHLKHVQKLVDFLGKCQQGVKFIHGANMTFAINTDKDGADRDQIFGWNHQTKTHTRYAYYSLGRDKYVLIVPKSTLLNSLDQAEILIDQKTDRVKLVYTHNNTGAGGHTVHFASSESAGRIETFPVPTKDKDGEPSLPEDFDCFVNLGHFKSLIQDCTGNEVELRLSPIEKTESRPRGGAMLRTIDNIKFDANYKIATGDTPVKFQCKVTRFMPSTS